jgi:acyl carrier protein
MSAAPDTVRELARKFGVLGEGDALTGLHSLLIIDLLLELERAAGVMIPTGSLTAKDFESVQTLTELVNRSAA